VYPWALAGRERGEQPGICAPQDFWERRPNWKNKKSNTSYNNAKKLSYLEGNIFLCPEYSTVVEMS
jgi:hypothetical protein